MYNLELIEPKPGLDDAVKRIVQCLNSTRLFISHHQAPDGLMELMNNIHLLPLQVQFTRDI